jgi:hypothetical protein
MQGLGAPIARPTLLLPIRWLAVLLLNLIPRLTLLLNLIPRLTLLPLPRPASTTPGSGCPERTALGHLLQH